MRTHKKIILLNVLISIVCSILIFYFGSIFYSKPKIRIAGGPELLSFRCASEAIADILSKEFVVDVKHTKGAVQNMKLLSNNQVELGFVHSSLQPPDGVEIFAIGNMFNSTLHIITVDKDIKQITDIREETRVVFGPTGSGTAMIADRLLNFYDISPKEKLNVSTFDAAREKLSSGQADVVFLVGGIPIDFLRGLSNKGRYQLVSIPNPEALQRVFPYLSKDTINHGVYGGRDLFPSKGVSTVAVKSVLVMSPEFGKGLKSRFLVERITNLILQNRQKLINSCPPTKVFTKEFASQYIVYPLHPGANKVYIGKPSLFSKASTIIYFLASFVTLIFNLLSTYWFVKENKWRKKIIEINNKTISLDKKMEKEDLSKKQLNAILLELLELKNTIVNYVNKTGKSLSHVEPEIELLNQAIERAKTLIEL